MKEILLDKKKKRSVFKIIFRSTSQVVVRMSAIYNCSDVFVDCGAISFQSDLF